VENKLGEDAEEQASCAVAGSHGRQQSGKDGCESGSGSDWDVNNSLCAPPSIKVSGHTLNIFDPDGGQHVVQRGEGGVCSGFDCCCRGCCARGCGAPVWAAADDVSPDVITDLVWSRVMRADSTLASGCAVGGVGSTTAAPHD
jgi:hypothetical protein